MLSPIRRPDRSSCKWTSRTPKEGIWQLEYRWRRSYWLSDGMCCLWRT